MYGSTNAKLYRDDLIQCPGIMKDFAGFIIMDNHLHLRLDGRLLEAIKLFTRLGGNAVNLVNLPDYGVPAAGYYKDIYGRTLKIADMIRAEFKIPVLVTLGPYPLDYFHFQNHSMDGFESMREGLYLAEKYLENSRADAIGEIGRPHFEYSPDRSDGFNSILEDAFKICHAHGAPAILHTEDLTPESYCSLQKSAKSAGIDPVKVVKHHALPSDLSFENSLTLSMLATRQNTREISRSRRRMFLETDYVDDPSSWKVIPPDSVPKRAIYIRENMDNWEDLFSNIFRDTPVSVFGSEHFAGMI